MNTVLTPIPTAGPRRSGLQRASLVDALRVVAEVAAPTIAKGVIIRRPGTMAVAERYQLDSRAIRLMQHLHERYGDGPLLIGVPGRTYALLLAPDHVNRVLDGTPEPFIAASDEKRAALAHFEPRGVLISTGPERADRRRFNEAVLDTARPTHHLGSRFVGVVDDEAERLLASIGADSELTWDRFTAAWHCVIRRVVFGDGARDDRTVTDVLAVLRADGNWAFMRRQRVRLRARFLARVARYVAQAEPGSLAAVMSGVPATDRTSPEQQVPQWLFAADAAGIATFRALALLLSHPAQAAHAAPEIAADDAVGALYKPVLRACILESLRLWPTTPAILRQSTEETVWDGARLPAGTGILIFAPYFHRDERRLPYAHRFVPEVWLGDRSPTDWPLVPFSAGPAGCPGQNLVLLLTSAMLGALLRPGRLRLASPPRLSPDRPLPGTLDHFALRFAAAR